MGLFKGSQYSSLESRNSCVYAIQTRPLPLRGGMWAQKRNVGLTSLLLYFKSMSITGGGRESQ